MAVESTNTYAGPYLTNGTAKAFPFQFRALRGDEVAVVLQAGGTQTVVPPGQYSVTLAAQSGTVTFPIAPASGSQLFVVSNPSWKQQISFSNQAPFLPTSHNEANDRAAIRDLALLAATKRSLQVPYGETAGVLPSALDRARSVLGFDALGKFASISYAALANTLVQFLPALFKGDRGERGRDTQSLAWREEFDVVPGQTQVVTEYEYAPGIVDVTLYGVEQSRADFAAPGNRVITFPAIKDAGKLIVKAFHLPNGDDLVVWVERYGAKGDGVTDDTAAICRCLNDAPEGARIEFTPDKVYRINGNYQALFGVYGGVKVTKHRQRLMGNGCTLKLFESPLGGYSIIWGYDVHGWSAVDFTLIGDREIHTGTGGEFGHGITMFGCDDVLIRRVNITQTWGDGITTLPRYGATAFDLIEDYCYRLRVEQCRIWKCSRNGISPIASRDSAFRDNTIYDIDRTAPMAAIDFEPDSGGHPNRNCVVDNLTCWGVELGVAVTVANQNVRVINSDLTANNSAFLSAAGSIDCHVKASKLRNTRAKTEGGAVRFVGGNAVRCSVTDCDMYGGGYFVVETNGGDEVFVDNNRIYPDNDECYGFARMVGGGSFLGNKGRMAANSGVDGVQFLQLHCPFGGGVFYYDGTKNVGLALLYGTDLGGDFYASARLKRGNGSSGQSPRVLRATSVENGSLGPVGPGQVVPVAVIGVDFDSVTIIANADGNGENGANRQRVHTSVYKTDDGARVLMLNDGGATQTLNIRLIVTSGR